MFMKEEQRQAYFLTASEERHLCRHFEFVLKEFCSRFQPPMPKYVLVIHDCIFNLDKPFHGINSCTALLQGNLTECVEIGENSSCFHLSRLNVDYWAKWQHIVPIRPNFTPE